MKQQILTILAALCLLHPTHLFAQCNLSPIFGDHMVLQRGEPLQVWGTAAPGAKVEISFGDQKASGSSDDKGEWKITLKQMPASGPFELKAASGSDSKVIKDVMVGDVWLISGQSNVVLALQAGPNWTDIRQLPVFDKIRVCKLPGNYSFDPTEQYSRAITWDLLKTGKVGYFSGVGYYFVRTIQPEIGVTVGLVQASAGGTQIEQWTPDDSLKAADPGNIQFALRDKARAQLVENAALKMSGIQTGAATMYNGTIYPMRFFKWAGVVWYQGEANSRVKADYRMLLKNLVQAWRKVFDEPQLPFVIIQLPNYGLPKDDGWMRLQEAQMFAARDMNFPLVVTIDQGSPVTIHPPDKAEVGRRAGLAALQHIYKKDVEGSSPMEKSVTFATGSAVVEFDGFKGDLVMKGDAVKGFELAGGDHKYVPATATLKGRTAIVKADGVAEPKSIRYLWANSPEAVTIYSAAGLPAGPFRIEEGNSKNEN